jgi:hypothetical protein
MALTKEDFLDDAEKLGCEVEAIMAVAAVESQGGGFNPDGTPKTLFEGHWFSRLTKHVYDKDYPTISYPKWTREFYGKSWQAEQARLEQARQLNQDAAFQAASWGMFQVMGFNHAMVGFTTVTDFVAAMCTDENEQLAAFTNYVIRNGLTDELQKKDWDGFAYRYNGPEYQKNRYAEKLAAAYTKAKGQ